MKKPTQKNRSLTERREWWLYYTRIRAVYARAKNRGMVARIDKWRTSLRYRQQYGDWTAVSKVGA